MMAGFPPRADLALIRRQEAMRPLAAVIGADSRANR
jgi:hypothetical protein